MSSKRQIFPRSIKNAAKKKAGFICSNPHCRRFLVDDFGNFNGKTGHIIAASENGPRASKDFKSDVTRIRSQANCILLCHQCEYIVDSKPTIYNEALLLDWKSYHERLINKILEDNYITPIRDELTKTHNQKSKEKCKTLDVGNKKLKEKNKKLKEENQRLLEENEKLIKQLQHLHKDLAIKDEYIKNTATTFSEKLYKIFF